MGRDLNATCVPDCLAKFSDQILAVAIRGVDAAVLSDAAIARAARIALARRHAVPRGVVTASVRQGWVTLHGRVGEAFQKDAARRAVASVSGISGITNDIAVESDCLAWEVQRKLAERFADTKRLHADHILVTIHDHMAILTGAAESETERQEADAAARSVMGIASVVNQIRVAAP